MKKSKSIQSASQFRKCVLIAAIAQALLSTSASAQSAVVEEVVIVGSKRLQLEQQATQSVNVLQPSELVNEIDAYNALLRLPNITTNTRGELPTVRGVDGSGVAVGAGAAISGGRPRFTTYVDGVARGHSFSTDGNASLWDVRQVEVYRGSQSSTLGRNASAGAMVITTNDPAAQNEGAAQVAYRSARTALSAAVMLNRAVTDDLSVRFTAEGLDGTNWNNPIHESLGGRSVKDLEKQEFQRFRLKALWTPESMPKLSVRFSHDNQVDASSNPPDLVTGPDFSRREIDELRSYSYFKRKNATTSAQVNYAIGGGWDFDTVVAHQRSRNDSVPAVDRDPRSLQVYAKSAETSVEPKFTYTAGKDSRTSAVAGAFVYSRGRNEGGVPGTAFVYDADDKIRTLSIFGDARVQLSSRWDVLAGIRFEREAQKRNLTGTFLGTFPAEIRFDEKVTEVLPKVGIDFHFDQDRSLGAVAYSGYQAPGVGVDFLGTGGTYTFGKEKSKTAELVWRSQWLSRTVTFNANIFQTNYRDYQLFGSDSAGGFIVKNAKKATIRGLELEANWQPTKGTSVFAQLGLLRARMNKFDDAENSYANGATLPEAPRHTFRIGASITPFTGVSLGADVYRSASFYSDVENIDAVLVPAHTTLNLNASWKFQSFTLSAYVNNVSNRFYLTGKVYPDEFKPRAYVSQPRTIGVSAMYKF